jgi:YHS domain-containing protein
MLYLPWDVRAAMRWTPALRRGDERTGNKGVVMGRLSLAPLRRLATACLLSLLLVGVAAADPPIPAVNTENGWAIKGYDPVAYFTTGKPTPGVTQFTAAYRGATYRFASAENRARFIATPEIFVPQYGGYCAYAIALNRIADIDPDEWAIVNDKLYLNNGFLAQTLWSLDKSGNITKGDQNWPLVPKLGNP